MTLDKLGLYVHFPFCEKKCFYCDFYSVNLTNDAVNSYIVQLKKEINEIIKIIGNRKVRTLYFGGGSPSCLSEKKIFDIYSYIEENFSLDLEEFTIEVNPKSKIRPSFLKKLGVNRVSMGIQSLNDLSLKAIGRNHKAKEAIQSLKNYAEIFDNLSCDLIIGIPYQTEKDIAYFIDMVSHYIKHMSVYMLEVPESSILKKLIEKGLDVADEDSLADLYSFTLNYLIENKFERYEVSNFSYPGYESKHNLIYWKYFDYIGLGPAACGKIGNLRYTNSSDILDYEKQWTELSLHDMENEYIMLSLRLASGLNFSDYYDRFKIDFLTKYKLKIKRLNKYFRIGESDIKIKNEYIIFENAILVDLLDF